ncbi:hypothetical protein BG006_000919 [Podila minutissima]|uniref:Uncharacterized protein n=1 Tax=Podila minutissima TaxID=64525 RepID=A0A9P5VHD7_9FUNG|nr:hypothetical protein BG006_000919 [Podila minutissima]
MSTSPYTPPRTNSVRYKCNPTPHSTFFSSLNKQLSAKATKITNTNTLNNKQRLPTMPFFKSSKSKNQTGSAATTPSQTPRSSMDQRSKPRQMTREEALEKLMTITMGNAASGPYIR